MRLVAVALVGITRIAWGFVLPCEGPRVTPSLAAVAVDNASVQAKLTLQIVELKEEIARLKAIQKVAIEVPEYVEQYSGDWKTWYETAAEQNAALRQEHQEQLQELADRCETLQLRWDAVVVQNRLLETALNQSQKEAQQAQDRLQSVRQTHTLEVERMQSDMDAANRAWQSKLAAQKEDYESALKKRGETICELEAEKRSVRALWRNFRVLLSERLKRRMPKSVPNPAAAMKTVERKLRALRSE